ncbi:glycosyltransferase family 2 protein [Myxococcota bacterium]|nr:glycosyltransferase family 2 protein [Myxococcota bacterium]
MKPCLLIPIFDHGEEITGVVESLAPAQLPCLIVDDGSNAATRAVLADLAEQKPWVEVHRRPRNGGRGAALKTGYREALARGYSHALQLDADGQHDARDVPAFLSAMREAPDALVLGAPIFDASAPKVRLYGRQLSRGLVWLTTWSFDVSDPLCGFRGVPLAATVAWLDAHASGDHMEFDPELVIGLHRAGVPVRNVPTHVVYRPGGLSHFDALRDNARLTAVYTRKLAGLLPWAFSRLVARTGGGGR